MLQCLLLSKLVPTFISLHFISIHFTSLFVHTLFHMLFRSVLSYHILWVLFFWRHHHLGIIVLKMTNFVQLLFKIFLYRLSVEKKIILAWNVGRLTGDNVFVSRMLKGRSLRFDKNVMFELKLKTYFPCQTKQYLPEGESKDFKFWDVSRYFEWWILLVITWILAHNYRITKFSNSDTAIVFLVTKKHGYQISSKSD